MRMFHAGLAVVGCLCVSCSSDSNSPSELATTTVNPAVLSVMPVSTQDSVTLARALGQYVAIALGNENVRAQLAAALDRSQLPEGKLHVQRFAAHSGAALFESIGNAVGVTADELKSAFRRLEDLEMYFPVPEHRANWQSSGELLVLPLLEADHTLKARNNSMTAFNTAGRAVTISTETPPDTPVLVILPTETAFSDDGEKPVSHTFGVPSVSHVVACPPEEQESCSGEGGGGSPPPPSPVMLGDSILITDIVINNVQTYEGWARGSPEIMVGMFKRGPFQDFRINIGCAGEHATGPHYFDMDDDVWTGRAFLIKKAAVEFALSVDDPPLIYVWEDDQGDGCDLAPEVIDSIAAETVYIAGQISVGVGIQGLILTGPVAGWALIAGGAVFAVAAYARLTSGDDWIGVTTVPDGYDPTTEPKTIMRKNGPEIRGSITYIFH